jgi:hypothetical protein
MGTGNAMILVPLFDLQGPAEFAASAVATFLQPQLRWIRHWPPAAFSSEQSWEASSDEANGPTIAR